MFNDGVADEVIVLTLFTILLLDRVSVPFNVATVAVFPTTNPLKFNTRAFAPLSITIISGFDTEPAVLGSTELNSPATESDRNNAVPAVTDGTPDVTYPLVTYLKLSTSVTLDTIPIASAFDAESAFAFAYEFVPDTIIALPTDRLCDGWYADISIATPLPPVPEPWGP